MSFGWAPGQGTSVTTVATAIVCDEPAPLSSKTIFEQLAQGTAWADEVRMHGRDVLHLPDDADQQTVQGVWHLENEGTKTATDGEDVIFAGTLRLNPADVGVITQAHAFKIDGVKYAVIRVARSTPFYDLILEGRQALRVGGSRSTLDRG